MRGSGHPQQSAQRLPNCPEQVPCPEGPRRCRPGFNQGAFYRVVVSPVRSCASRCGLRETFIFMVWYKKWCMIDAQMWVPFLAMDTPRMQAVEVRTMEDCERAIETVGFPMVVKPTSGAGSQGVYRADTPEEVRNLVSRYCRRDYGFDVPDCVLPISAYEPCAWLKCHKS